MLVNFGPDTVPLKKQDINCFSKNGAKNELSRSKIFKFLVVGRKTLGCALP